MEKPSKKDLKTTTLVAPSSDLATSLPPPPRQLEQAGDR